MNVDLEWELIKLQQLVLHSLNLGESLHKNIVAEEYLHFLL